METFSDHYSSLYQTLNKYMPNANVELIERAIQYAQDKHKDQKRKDGSPYIIHPLAVAEIVAEIGLDMDAILGALLHDCIEDTDASHEEIEKLFGQTVAELAKDTLVTIGWAPDRVVKMKYLGNFGFEVISSENSQLRPGDKFELSEIIVGYPLYISRILRDGEYTPSYVAGQPDGINLLKVTSL